MAHLPTSIARVRHALRTFLTDRRAAGELHDGDLLLVACSGGADSLALAAQLAFLAPRAGVRGGMVTVDHAMQPGSAQQAGRVARLGRDVGLDPVLVKTAPEAGEEPEVGGPEARAREIRYRALAESAAETGARAVLLGHTMEDQAETVLLGLLRGAGTRAVAGMRPVRDAIWRPLLQVRREETEETCAHLGLPVWHDPTNVPDGPWRTRAGAPLPRAAIRHTVLPELSRALGQDPVLALARTAELAGEDADLLDGLAAEYSTVITPGGEDAVLSADVEELRAIPRALRRRVLREMMIRAGAPGGQVGMAHVRSVEALITDWRGQRGASIPGGLYARRSCGRLVIVPLTTTGEEA